MFKIKDGLYGLCVADALGVPAETRPRKELQKDPITGMTSGGVHKQPAGYWSDDSSMTLCLADSIAKVGYYHTHDIMRRFVEFYAYGAYTPAENRFDCGGTCSKAIHRFAEFYTEEDNIPKEVRLGSREARKYFLWRPRGCTPALCGSNKENENGNGSVMRILPMAFVLYKKYGIHITKSKRAMEDIHKISGLTHRHPLAQSACGIYLAIAVRLLDGYELKAAIREGIYEALQWYGAHGRFTDCLDFWEKISDPDDLASLPNEIIYSGGYVVETMETVLWALMNTDNYKDCVLTCVNMGYDADSTAAIAGGLAGIYYGYESIPKEWVEQLARKDIIDGCIRKLEMYFK